MTAFAAWQLIDAIHTLRWRLATSAAVQAAQVSGLQLLLLDHTDGRVDWANGTEQSERPSSRHGSSVMPFTAVRQAFGRREAARAAVQAAQVIEARLSRYGTITTYLPAAPASVVACCAAHCQLLEACQAGASHFRLLDYTLPVRVLVKRPRTAPAASLRPRVSPILTTAAW